MNTLVSDLQPAEPGKNACLFEVTLFAAAPGKQQGFGQGKRLNEYYAGGGDGNFYKLENNHHHNINNWFAKYNLLKILGITTVEMETFGKLRLAASRCSRTRCCCHTEPSLSCPSSLHPRHVRVRHANDAEVEAHHSFMKFDLHEAREVAPQVRVLEEDWNLGPTCQPTVICNSCYRGFDTLSWHL